MGKHALALDNLLSADVVLADGKIVTASEDNNSDLFWALRGGGGNFGVVASFEYRLHAVGPIVTGGLIAYPFSAAWDLLRYFRDVTARSEEHTSELQSLMRISYAVFCLKKKINHSIPQ